MTSPGPTPRPDATASPARRPEPGAVLPSVTAVVVAYGREEWLERSIQAILESEGVDVEVVIVDNGGTGDSVDRLAGQDRVRMVRPDHNTGFATGCNLGVDASTRPFVALVNPDAVVEPIALAELVAVASEAGVGLATASVRLADDPRLLNSAGNDIHFLGVSWAGWFGEPAADHPHRRTVTAASGAALVCRREVWAALGGFCDELFAYCEDAELSLRCWQRGWDVVYVPSAVVVHRYEFSRNPIKYRLLERNRTVLAATCFSTRHLVLIAPLLVALELGTLAYATRHGWLREKLAAYAWLWRQRAWLRSRRRTVLTAGTRPARDLNHLYEEHLRPANLDLPDFVRPLDRLLAGYWRAVRRFI